MHRFKEAHAIIREERKSPLPSHEELSDRDGIRIGVIGPDEVLALIAQALLRFPTFRPVFAACESEDAAPQLAEKLAEMTEVLLFAGPLGYRKTQEQVRLTVPALYVPLTGSGLYRALHRLVRRGPIETVTVDSLTRPMIEKAAGELGETFASIRCYTGAAAASADELVGFHLEAGTSAGGGALTGVKATADRLAALGVATEWVAPTEEDIIVTLERALLSTKTRRSMESQIVLGLMAIDNPGRLFERSRSEHDAQKLKLDIHRTLLGYAESLEGHLTHLGGDEYLFITTRGVFERETRGYKYIPIAREIEMAFGVTLSVGVGFGLSANDAGTHARIALRHAREAGGNISFIVREDGGVIGPLEMTEPLERNLALIDSEVVRKAEQNGMSAAYLSKLAASVSRKGQLDYTAQELASILGITVRSVHRLLLLWVDSELIESIGERKSEGKGRPKQIFRLTFLDDLAVSRKRSG